MALNAPHKWKMGLVSVSFESLWYASKNFMPLQTLLNFNIVELKHSAC